MHWRAVVLPSAETVLLSHRPALRVGRVSAAAYTGETECKMGAISASGTSVITGDFASKIHLDVDTTDPYRGPTCGIFTIFPSGRMMSPGLCPASQGPR
jgi:hypothetical protein